MSDDLQKLVFDTLKVFGENETIAGLENPAPETPLYGDSGVLDSLALVSLIADLEVAVEERLGVPVTLADERAMSRRRSPFRTAGALTEFVEEVVREERKSF